MHARLLLRDSSFDHGHSTTFLAFSQHKPSKSFLSLSQGQSNLNLVQFPPWHLHVLRVSNRT